MIEGGSCLSLTLESLQRMLVSGQLLGQELQGDESVELGVFGLIDDTHTPFPNLFQYSIVEYGFPNHLA